MLYIKHNNNIIMNKINLLKGDCLETMKTLASNTVDSIVCDPPYGISFMAKKWDYSIPSVDVWKEALRVLKPGGHALIACGTKTQHRMVVNIEDAGFEIRDVVTWMYGSGFPKSHNISKAIDKCNGDPNRLEKFTTWMRTTGLKAKDLDEVLRASALISQTSNMAVHFFNAGQPQIATARMWKIIRPMIKIEIPNWIDELVDRIEAEREVVGSKKTNKTVYQAIGEANTSGEINITTPATEAAKQYDGWGTALKPSCEFFTTPATEAAKQYDGWGTALKPSCEFFTLCRKPLSEKTVAANVLKWGTGGINIDGCRVGGTGEVVGRFPANLIHDGSDEVLDLFPGEKEKSAARFFYCPKANKVDRNEGLSDFEEKESTKQFNKGMEGQVRSNGSIVKEGIKQKNNHPTVKPTPLMQYLCRLITPTNGTVLDCFMGSGSTGKAAVLEGFNFVGCELDEDYFNIATARIEAANKK